MERISKKKTKRARKLIKNLENGKKLSKRLKIALNRKYGQRTNWIPRLYAEIATQREIAIKKCKELQRETAKRRINAIKEMHAKGTKAACQIMKKKKERTQTVIEEENKLITDPDKIRNIIGNYWKKEYERKQEQSEVTPSWLHNLPQICEEATRAIHRKVKKSELKYYIKTRPEQKSQGPDGIAFEALKKLGRRAQKIIRNWCNGIITEGKVAESEIKKCWSKLIYKEGKDHKLCSAYRPIALLSIMIKLIGAIINDRLNSAMNQSMIFANNMFGFRPHMGTQEAIRTLTRTIEAKGDNEIHILFTDIQGAFTTVELWSLRQTMKALGFHEKTIHMLMQMAEGYSMNNSYLIKRLAFEKLQN